MDIISFMERTSVTGKNQVSIPAEIARRYGIRPGYKLGWSEGSHPDELIVRVIPDRKTWAEKLLGSGRKYLGPEADLVGALIRERESDMGEDER